MSRAGALILGLLACAAALGDDESPRPRPAPVSIIAPPLTVLPGGLVTSELSSMPGAKTVTPLADLMRKLGEPFTDATAAASSGRLDLASARALVIASGALGERDGRIGKVLWDARKAVADFVENGGVLVVFTSPADAGALAFLPGVTQASIEPLSHASRVVTIPDHPLVAGRHALAAHNLGSGGAKPGPGALYPGGCYGVYLGLSPVVALDARGRYPVILDGPAGRGRVILIHLSPDRAFSFGTEDEKISAALVVENLLAVVHGTLAGDLAAPRPRPDRAIRGTVFEDTNANGVRDPGERTLGLVDVSDGVALVKTDIEGNYYLPLDCYSEFVWVAADLATYRAPLWRRIPPTGATVDIGLVPRKTALGAAARIAHVVDTGGLFNPDDKDDPDFAWTLGEIARIAPKPDVLVLSGDTTLREMRAATLAKLAGDLDVLNVFVPGPAAGDPVAERDAFARTFGPTAYLARLGPREIAATCPRLIEGRLPGRLAAATPGRVTFEGAAYRVGALAGPTPSFRRRGVMSPPTATLFDLTASTSRVEPRLLGITGLLHCVEPASEGVMAAGKLSVRVVSGDTSAGPGFPIKLTMSKIVRRADRLDIEEPSLGDCRLASVGRLTRAAQFNPDFLLDPAYYVLHLAGVPEKGDRPLLPVGPEGASHKRGLSPFSEQHVTFTVPGGGLPAPGFGMPWYSTGGGDSREGSSEGDAVLPPFYLSGVATVGPVAPGAAPAVFSDVVLVPGIASASPEDAPAQAGLPALARRLDVPFACCPQGRYELKGDHAEFVSGPVLRYEFGVAKPDPASSRLAVGGDMLCVVDERGSAWGFARARGAEVKDTAFDAKTALEALRWKTDVLPGCRRAATTPLEIFTGAECIEIGSGHVRWSWEKYALRGRSCAAFGKFVVAAGVTAGTPAKQLALCFDSDTGRLLWEKTLASDLSGLDDVDTPAPTLVKGFAFIGSADGVMRALRLSDAPGAPAGSEAWSFRTGDSVLPLGPGNLHSPRIVSQALVTETCVFFGGCDGRFYALDRRKGTLLWSYDLGLPVVGSPALSGNTLVVADWDGNVYGFTTLAVKKPRK